MLIVLFTKAFTQVSYTITANKDYVVPALGPTGLDVTGVASTIDKVNQFVYTAGSVNTPSAGRDLYLVKHTYNGTQKWVYQYDYAGLNDKALAVCVDPSTGNVFITGQSEQSTGNSDIVTIALDSTGAIIWSGNGDKRFNGTNNTNDAGNTIALDGAGNVWVAGYSTTASKGKDVQILKYAISTGSLLASPKKNGTANTDDIANKIVIAGTNLFLTGSINNGAGDDIFLTALNTTSATVSWTNTVNGSASGNDAGNDIKVDGSSIIFCGSVNEITTGNDYYFGIMNASTGVLTYTNTYDGGFNGSDIASSLVCDKLGNYAITGLVTNGSLNEIHSVLYNSGMRLWAHPYPINGAFSTTYPKIACDTIIKAFYVASTYSNAVTGNLDGLLYQISPTGATTWHKEHNGANNGKDIHTDLVLDGLGRIYLASDNETATANVYNIELIRYSQSVLWPVTDSTGEDFSRNYLYYENRGQLLKTDTTRADSVKYYNTFAGPAYYLYNDRVSYMLAKMDSSKAVNDSIEKMQIRFAGCNPYAEAFAFDPVDMNLNFFTAATDSNGITDVVGNKRVYVPNIYPDVDLQYYSNRNGLKYYFVVKPWAPETLPILITTAGTQTSSVASGDLVLTGELGNIDLGGVQSYQVDSMGVVKTMTTMVTWNQVGPDSFNFNIPPYNHNLPLVIMVSRPTGTLATANTSGNYNYGTFYGGSGDEGFNAIHVDKNDNRYVAGFTKSQFYPTLLGLNLGYKGVQDVVVNKYVKGDTLKFATIFGGNDFDNPTGIGLLSNGHIVVCGNTQSTNFPVIASNKPTADQQLSNSVVPSNPNSTLAEGFITELTNKGNQIYWGRYIGGSRNDLINDMVIDKNDNMYFVGATNSCEYPVKNAYKTAPANCFYGINQDLVYTKMNASSQIQYSSYFGGDNTSPSGTNADWAEGVDVDTIGYVYIVGGIHGSSDLSMFNSTGNSSPQFNSSSDGTGGIVMRINNSTGQPDFCAEIGKKSSVLDVKVMPDATIMMCGITPDTLTQFPLLPLSGAYNRAIPGSCYKGFIANVDYQMAGIWVTMFNNDKYCSGGNSLNRIAVSANGSFYLSGIAYGDSITLPSSSFPGMYNDSAIKLRDGFISYFSSNAHGYQLLHSHYLGGSNADGINDIGVYANSSLYAVGYTYGYWDALAGHYVDDFPIFYTTANASLIDPTYNLGEDCFISRFDISTLVISVKELGKNDNGLSITSFPNPVSDLFYIDTEPLKNEKGGGTIKIYNTAGALIYSDKLNNFNKNLVPVPCSAWSNGLYVINVTTESKVYSGKVVKQ